MKAWSVFVLLWLVVVGLMAPCRAQSDGGSPDPAAHHHHHHQSDAATTGDNGPAAEPSGTPAFGSKKRPVLAPTPEPHLAGEWMGRPTGGWSPTDNSGITLPIYSNDTADGIARPVPMVSPDRSMYAHFALLASFLIILGMAIGKTLLERVRGSQVSPPM